MDLRAAALQTWTMLEALGESSTVKRVGPGRVRVGTGPSAPFARGTWCWHCSHPFSGEPIPLPIGYDERRQEWKVLGEFCSFACAKRHNLDSGNPRSGERGMLLTLLRRRATGVFGSYRAAPPRQCLVVFGGSMSIEEFRDADAPALVALPPRMVPGRQIIEEQRASRAVRRRAEDVQDLTEPVDFGEVQTHNDALRLKRPKPLQSDKNVLARAMGLGALFAGQS